jgi:hypothetical protein
MENNPTTTGTTGIPVDEQEVVSVPVTEEETAVVIPEEPEAPKEEIAPKAPYVPTQPPGAKVAVAANFIVARTDANGKTFDSYEDVPPVSILGTSLNVLEHISTDWDKLDATAETTEWSRHLSNAASYSNVVSDGLNAAAFRPTANWVNSVGYAGTIFGPRKLVPGAPSGSGTLKGREAVLQMSAMTSMGGANSFPLWGSGFSVTLRTPPLSEQVELDRLIASDRNLLGRNTRGAIFSNDSFAINRNLIRFIYDHCVSVGIESGNDYEKFLEAVRLPDMQILAAYMAHCIHSAGFPFAQPCTSDPNKCTHVARRQVLVAKMVVVDHNMLNSNQLKIITRPGKVSDADLKSYQDEFYYANNHIVLTDTVKVFFSVPSVAKHIHSGARWATELEHRTETAFGTVLSEAERIKHYTDMRIATILRNYGHWIDRIEMTVGDHLLEVSDDEAIEEQLGIWSENDDFVNAIVEGIEKFMNESLVSFVGIPNYECPNCHDWLVTENGETRVVHPIDGVSTFFLMQQSYLLTKLP